MMGLFFAAVAASIVGLFGGILAWILWQKHTEMRRGDV